MKLQKRKITCDHCKETHKKNYISYFEDIPMFVVCVKCAKTLEEAEDIYRIHRDEYAKELKSTRLSKDSKDSASTQDFGNVEIQESNNPKPNTKCIGCGCF